MVEEWKSVIGFGLMVKGVDFYLFFLNCGSPESLKFLIVAFGQCHPSNFSKKKKKKKKKKPQGVPVVCWRVFN